MKISKRRVGREGREKEKESKKAESGRRRGEKALRRRTQRREAGSREAEACVGVCESESYLNSTCSLIRRRVKCRSEWLSS